MREELETHLNLISGGDEVVKQVTYLIWGAVVSTTRAFGRVKIKIDPETQRVFLAIELRWWARSNRLLKIHKYWLAKAERKCKPHIPAGWKSLFYYRRGNDDGDGTAGSASDNG